MASAFSSDGGQKQVEPQKRYGPLHRNAGEGIEAVFTAQVAAENREQGRSKLRLLTDRARMLYWRHKRAQPWAGAILNGGNYYG